MRISRVMEKIDRLTWEALCLYGRKFADDWADTGWGDGASAAISKGQNRRDETVAPIEKVVAGLRALQVYTIQQFVGTKDPRTIGAIVRLSEQLAEQEGRLQRWYDEQTGVTAYTGSEGKA